MTGNNLLASNWSDKLEGMSTTLADPVVRLAAHYGLAVAMGRTQAAAVLKKQFERSYPQLQLDAKALHKLSSTQFNLADVGYTRTQGPLEPKVRRLAEKITPEDLSEEGVEDRLHVTCLYGLHTSDPEEVQRVVEAFGPMRFRLGKTSLFQNEDTDVVKVEVHSPDLHRLHELLAQLEHTDTHPDYVPQILFSDQDKHKTTIGLCTNRPWQENIPLRGSVSAPLALPFIHQATSVDCGAAVAMSVARYFAVAESWTLANWRRSLGTDENGTDPAAIVRELRALGLSVEERHGMSVADLEQCWRAGKPVLIPLQDWNSPEYADTDESGHWCAVVGIGLGGVLILDPNADDEATDGSVAEPGRRLIDAETFLRVWHDETASGDKLVRYGIVVGPMGSKVAPTPTKAFRYLSKDFCTRLNLRSFTWQGKDWSEQDHPRDKNGHFVRKGKLAEAAADPQKATELRRTLNPADRVKLDNYLKLNAEGKEKFHQGHAAHEATQQQKQPAGTETAAQPASAAPSKAVRAGVFLVQMGKAIAHAPQAIRERAVRELHETTLDVHDAVDFVLKRALPHHLAEEVKEIAVKVMLDAAQEELLENVLAGFQASESEEKPEARQTMSEAPSLGKAGNWKTTAAIHVTSWAATKAAFSLCKKYSTDLCKKLAKALP